MHKQRRTRSGLEVIKLNSCSYSTQLSMKFFMLINLKLLTVANSVFLNIGEHGNSSTNKYGKCQLANKYENANNKHENFSANKFENANYCWHFHIY